MDELTDTEIDYILERYDKTEPKLQRKIVASIIMDNMKLKKERDKLQKLAEARNNCIKTMECTALGITPAIDLSDIRATIKELEK